MRIVLTVLLFAALVSLSGRADAMSLELNAAQSVEFVDAQIGNDLSITQAGCTSLSQAVEQIRRRTKGRVLSAETRIQGGREVHYIKVHTPDGKVKTHRVNGCRR